MISLNEENSIDSIDRQLLALVQQNNQTGTELLGEKVGLSATAAKRRLNKLRENGTIAKDVSIIDPKRLGFDVFTIVQVNLERDRRDIMHSFKLAVQESPQVIQAFYTTGDSDFVLLVASRSLAEYEVFTQEFFWENKNIKNFKTMVVMENIKMGFALPIG